MKSASLYIHNRNICFYYLETHIFEESIFKLLKPNSNILDLGCGICELWCNNVNKVLYNNFNVLCIDINEESLKFPRNFYIDTNQK